MTLLAERRALRWVTRQSRTLRFLPLTTLVSDVAVIIVTMIVAAIGHDLAPHTQHLSNGDLIIAGPIIVLLWILVMGGFGAYQAEVFGAGADEYKRVLHGSLYSVSIVGVACYLAHFTLARGFFILMFVIGVPALLIERRVIRHGVHLARMQGKLQERTVIAGSISNVDDIAAVLRREAWLGYRVVGALCPGSATETPSGIPIIGHDDLATIHRVSSNADVVFLAGGTDFNSRDMRQLQWSLEQDATRLIVAPNVNDISSERVRVRPVGGLPLMHIDGPRWSHATQKAKRVFDVIGSLTLLLLFSPLMLAIALRIKLHDGGTVLFAQTRVGRNARTFSCLKFRTMVPNAEDLLAALHAQAGYTGGLFKMEDDPRITGPGRILRKYSLDELPQLINVLRGEMSLVGPRPNLVHEVAQYEKHMTRRLRVRPGMTGLWQVSGRANLSWEEAIRLDLYYVDNWSMLQDINILIKTVRVITAGSGAY